MNQPAVQTITKECFICHKPALKEIPAAWDCSMTTAGRRVSEPLSKFQCMSCGLLQRAEIRHLGDTDFYEKYYSFYERPGAGVYDLPRYRAMASWIKGGLGDRNPQNVLDAGCGRGWMLEAMREVYPNASFMGIEPSTQESENARKRGFDVLEAKVSPDAKIGKKFDLIYSTNVIEHTSDPVSFLSTLKDWLTDDGCIVITCPDSSTPSSEFMFSDQNFSFTPRQLTAIANNCGMYLNNWQGPPNIDSAQNKQLLLFAQQKPTEGIALAAESDPQELFEQRSKYVQSYKDCDDYLCQQTADYEKVYNFGTSTFSWLLSCYCPNYWEKVSACVIDNPEKGSRFQDKDVIDRSAVDLTSGSVLCLGVNPNSQGPLQERLSGLGIDVVRWDQLISC